MKTFMTRGIPAAVFASVVVFVAFIAALRWAGLLTVTGSDPNSKVIGAALALVGAFLGAILTFTASLLKHSLDERSEQRLALEANRNAALQEEGENRLKLEAAIQAIQLFALNTGAPSLPIQRAGALFTLASLGQHSLTLALVDELLNAGQLEPSTAAAVVDQALRSDDESVRNRAIDVLAGHPEKFLTKSGVAIPTTIFMNLSGQSAYVREWAVIALGSALIARPLKEWEQALTHAAELLAVLAMAWLNEPDPELRRNVAAVLAPVCEAFPQMEVIHHPLLSVELLPIRQNLTYDGTERYATSLLAERIKEWASPSPEAPTGPPLVAGSGPKAP